MPTAAVSAISWTGWTVKSKKPTNGAMSLARVAGSSVSTTANPP